MNKWMRIAGSIAVGVGLAFAVSADGAGDSGASITDFFSVQPQDKSAQILSTIFGPNAFSAATGFTGGAASIGYINAGTEGGIIGVLSQVFNVFCMALLVIMILYRSVTGVAHAAYNGAAAAQRYDTLWEPARAVLAFGMLLPVIGGYSLVQVIIMRLLMISIGIANAGFAATLNYVDSGKSTVPVIIESVGGIGHNLLGALVCQHAAKDTDGSPLVQATSASNSSGSAPLAAGSPYAVQGDAGTESLTYDLAFSGMAGSTLPTSGCGHFHLSVPVRSDSNSDAALRQYFQAKVNALLQLRVALDPIAAQLVQLTVPSGSGNLPSTMPRAPGQNFEPLIQSYQSALARYRGSLQAASQQVAAVFAGHPIVQGEQPVMPAEGAVRSYGWIYAGALYWNFQAVNREIAALMRSDSPGEGPNFGDLLQRSSLPEADQMQNAAVVFSSFMEKAENDADFDPNSGAQKQVYAYSKKVGSPSRLRIGGRRPLIHVTVISNEENGSSAAVFAWAIVPAINANKLRGARARVGSMASKDFQGTGSGMATTNGVGRVRHIALGLLLPAAAGIAADEPATVPTQLDQVVVTADRRSGYANTVPSSITTYTGDDLRVLGIEDTRDLGKIVPGFTFADTGFSVPTYTLRGVGFADSSFTTTSTVGIYNDEVSLAYPIMSKGLNLDLRRVEVVKGPQGTLYGRNATAGAINYVANTPTPYFSNGGEVAYGSYGRVDANGYISGPIPGFGGALKGRIAYGIVNSTEGWQISQTRPDDRLGKINKQAARGLLDWQALDNLQVRFTLSGWLDRSEPQAPFAVALQPQNPFFGQAGLDPTVRNYPVNANNDDPRAAEWNPSRDFRLRDNYWLGSVRPSWDITDDINLTGIFSYQQVRSDGAVLPQGGLPADDINDQLNAFIRTISAELRLSGPINFNGGERGDWLVGVNGNYDKQHEVILGLASENSLNILQFGDTPPLNKPIFFEKGGAKSDGTVHSGSVFTDGNLKLLEDVKLTLGARYTQEAQDYAGCTFISADNDSIIPFPYFTIASAIRRGLPAPTAGDLASLAALQSYLGRLNPTVSQGACGSIDANGNAGLVTGTLNQHNFSYRSVLSWTPDRNTLLYGSYSRGYKSGGFPTIFSVDQRSLAPVVQERLDAYEIGAKWTTWRGRFHVDASTYYYQYKDKQLLTYFKDPIFGSLQYLQNVPKSFNNGAELSATLIPFKQLYLTALGSYVRTKVVEYQGLTSQGTAFDFAGQPFNYTPRTQATLIANYTFALNRDLNVTPGVSFSYTGGTNATLEHDPIFAMNDHRVWDARLGLSPPDRRWTLTAYARNLTNEFYRNSVIKLGDSVFAYTGAPQLYGVSLTYDLGKPRR